MSLPTERSLIDMLAAGMPRSPHQRNKLHESDAELLQLPGTDVVLAITTDGVVEEIAAGLYRDPYLAGWMVVAANMSDLAAVGADPIGIVISECLPPNIDPGTLRELQRGIRDSAREHGVAVLGGDTNISAALELTGTAIGTIMSDVLLTRRGARPGDRLFASGPVGLGTAFSFAALMDTRSDGTPPVPFRPVARTREGQSILGIASACMDTSDGVIAALDELMQLNGVGFEMDLSLDHALHPAAMATAKRAGLPPWTMLAGPHGEFELLFTVPSERHTAMLRAAQTINWHPLELGTVTDGKAFHFQDGSDEVECDASRIRNLFVEVGGHPQRYLESLLGPAAPTPAGAGGRRGIVVS